MPLERKREQGTRLATVKPLNHVIGQDRPWVCVRVYFDQASQDLTPWWPGNGSVFYYHTGQYVLDSSSAATPQLKSPKWSLFVLTILKRSYSVIEKLVLCYIKTMHLVLITLK